MKEAAVRLSQERISIVMSSADVADLDLRAQQGNLLVEFGTPGLFSQQSPSQHQVRQTMTLPQNVCAKITKVWVDDDDILWGTIVPEGPKRKLIKQCIERGTPEKLKFGVRLFVEGNQYKVAAFDLIGF